ncbi:hypothetical protein D9M68_359460 [compost metagenome]
MADEHHSEPPAAHKAALPRHASHKRRRLDRSTQFILAAIAILGLTMALVGQVVSLRIERAAVQSSAEAVALYMENLLEPHIQDLSTGDRLSAQSLAALDELMTNASLSRHIRSVKIWHVDGTVLYSTDKSKIGKRFPTHNLRGALAGRVVTELEELDDDESDFERTLSTSLYEIYMPLRDMRSGRILAVGEFYETADVLAREISYVRQQLWSVVAIATLAMLILLFFVVQRGDRIIERQQAALEERVIEQARLHARNRMLQRRISNANQEFSRVNELTLRRIGADLHDGPLQMLTLVLLMLDDLREQGKNDTPTDDSTYETMRGAAQDAMREIRDLSRGLMLPEIADLSLSDELELVAQRHEQKTGSSVTRAFGPLPADAPLPLKLCLYRFVQEGLNNAFRHAAGEGQRVEARQQGGLLVVTVSDSGPGISQHDLRLEWHGRSRLGLAGMRYRVEALGGKFSIDSAPGQGTRLVAQFKL